MTGSDVCYFDSPETPEEAQGRPVVTAEEKFAARVKGAVMTNRHLHSEQEVLADIDYRLDSWEQIGQAIAALRKEIRVGRPDGQRWSSREIANEVDILQVAVRRVGDMEKLHHQRNVLAKGLMRPRIDVRIAPFARISPPVAASSAADDAVPPVHSNRWRDTP